MKWNNHKEKVFWILYHAGFVLFAAGTGMLMKYLQTGDALHPTWVVSAAVIYIMSSCIGYLAVFMVRKAENYDHNKLKKRLLPLLVLFYAASYLIANLAITLGALGWFLYIGRDMKEFAPSFQNELNFGKEVSLSGSWSSPSFLLFSWRKSVTREQSLMEESQIQIQYLKTGQSPFSFQQPEYTLRTHIQRTFSGRQLSTEAGIRVQVHTDNEENSLVPGKRTRFCRGLL